jgi:type II secretory pathway pseudopilin PulG
MKAPPFASGLAARTPARRVRFTLIEVIVASIILTIVSASLIAAFHAGLTAYGKTTGYERARLALAGAQAAMEADFRRLVPFSNKEVEFKENSMRFFIAVESPGPHLEKVAYYGDGASLIREATSYWRLDLSGDDADGSVKAPSSKSALLDSLGSLRFAYLEAPKAERGESASDVKPDGKSAAKASASSGGDGKPKDEDSGLKPFLKAKRLPKMVAVEMMSMNASLKTSILVPVYRGFVGGGDQDAPASSGQTASSANPSSAPQPAAGG